jgi:hypothetical protein
VILNLKSVQDSGKLGVELHVNDGTDNLCDASSETRSLAMGGGGGSLSGLGSLSLLDSGDVEAAGSDRNGPAFVDENQESQLL